MRARSQASKNAESSRPVRYNVNGLPTTSLVSPDPSDPFLPTSVTVRTRSTIARQQNAAISNGVNWIASIGIFPADAVEIVAEMMIFGESLRVIG